jgi:hypothetical protein
MVVYVIIERDVRSNRETIRSIHETFDGAYSAMKAEYDRAVEKQGDLDDFQVLECGRLVKRFYVITTHTEK